MRLAIIKNLAGRRLAVNPYTGEEVFQEYQDFPANGDEPNIRTRFLGVVFDGTDGTLDCTFDEAVQEFNDALRGEQ